MGQRPHCSNDSLEYLLYCCIPLRQAYLPSYETQLPCTFPRPSPFKLFSVGIPKRFLWSVTLFYANNLQTTAVLKNNIRTEIRRIPHEILDRAIRNISVGVARVIQRQGAWIKHINRWAVLANWWCTRKNARACIRAAESEVKYPTQTTTFPKFPTPAFPNFPTPDPTS